ncbi:hypothetical protein BKE38_27125 [Pseudoroseomonas deserti]|uniref:Uncharacterized protein n=1 Tax=Teichococcus deserti TaxID=1817963 RepID=A0A1V2GU90_9PROT|nr:hypothetical protein [Pseudoroseomonas deserti]ONG44939.1 hypothetical protein BKE38_27125 [Pseudoroseomonas deserti]
MIRSRPVVIDGRFIGVAVAQEGSWRFIANDPAARGAEGQLFPGLPGLQQRVQAALIESRMPAMRRAG